MMLTGRHREVLCEDQQEKFGLTPESTLFSKETIKENSFQLKLTDSHPDISSWNDYSV